MKKKTKRFYVVWAEIFVIVILVLGVLGGAFIFKNSQPLTKTSTPSLVQSSISGEMKPATATASLALQKPSTSSALTLPAATGPSVRVPILMYHYIGNNPNPADKARYVLSTAPDMFDTQMGYLAKNGYTPISLDTLYASLHGGILPPKPIVLTFDDGYEDFYYNAWPILMKYHFHATSFIPTGLMNQGYYMSWAQIKQIQASGIVSFEAHSVDHPNLPSLNMLAQKNEILTSKQVLEQETGSRVNFFAYPYGTSSAITQELVKETGFAGAVGTWYGTTEAEGDKYDWPRVRIVGGISMAEFASKL